MKVYSTVLDDPKMRDLLLQNSIERVINTSVKILQEYVDWDTLEEDENETCGINSDDWEALKPLVVALWNEARNSIHIRLMQEAGDKLGAQLAAREEDQHSYKGNQS